MSIAYSEYTKQKGKFLHKMAEICLIKNINPEDLRLKRIDIDEIILVKKYLKYVRSFIRKGRYFKVEKPIYYRGEWLIPDFFVVSPQEDRVDVFDLKTGINPVHPMDDDKMPMYGLAVAEKYGKLNSIHLHIVQPTIDNIAVVELTKDEAETFVDEYSKFGENMMGFIGWVVALALLGALIYGIWRLSWYLL